MDNLKTKKDLILVILGALGLYLISTGLSYAAFSSLLKPSSITSPVVVPTGEKESKFKVDITAPKTEECPLNGSLFTLAEKEIWSARRPLTVMIENHLDSRPQSGLSKADVVYEAVAEGGITRFLTVFYCAASAYDWQIGPIRSARTYFLDFASEYGDFPLYVHVGGANMPGRADAIGQISNYGWRMKNDLDQFSIGFPTYWRDENRLGHPVATEHTMYSTVDKLWKVAEKRGFTNVDKKGSPWDKSFISWKFKEDAPSDERENKSLEFYFWKASSFAQDYKVRWEHDGTENVYKRINAGILQKDRDDETVIKVKNVVVVFMKELKADDGYENNAHLLYGTKGSGKILVFQDGKAVEGTWSKKDRKERMFFKDAKGKELKLNRGQIWIEILPVGSEVIY